MLVPQVLLRFADDEGAPYVVGLTDDLGLARVVAERLVIEADAAAEVAAQADPRLGALFKGEAARIRAAADSLAEAEPLRLMPR